MGSGFRERCMRGRGRGGGGAYVQPLTLADVRQVVFAAMREERAGQASQSNLLQVARAPAAPPSAAPPATAPPAAAPPPPAPAVPTAAPGARIQLPWVPPLHHVEVPEATLGQLWRLSESLQAIHLIQVYGLAALSRGNTLDDGPLDECLDVADQLAEIMAPVLAAPARGGVAGVGQLDTAGGAPTAAAAAAVVVAAAAAAVVVAAAAAAVVVAAAAAAVVVAAAAAAVVVAAAATAHAVAMSQRFRCCRDNIPQGPTQ
ncbi:unnamed protein product [Closterium sp. NIES-53]